VPRKYFKQGFAALIQSQVGVLNFLGAYIAIPVYYLPVMFGKACADLIQQAVSFAGLLGASGCPACIDIPKFGIDVEFTTELHLLAVDCDASHNGAKAVLLGLAFLYVEKQIKCTSHNSTFLMIQNYFLLSYLSLRKTL